MTTNPRCSSLLRTLACTIALACPAPAMAQAAAPAAQVSTQRGFQVSLEADAGYSYLTNMFDLDKGGAHGMLYGATVNIWWPTKEPSYSGGIRLRGFAAPQMNMVGHTFFMTDDATYFVGGASLGVVFENRWGWASANVGLFRTVPQGNSKDAINLFEYTMAGGLRLPLGSHFALKAGVEVGTMYFLTWRFSATAGAELTF
jgi:hypothetical protein